MVYFRQILNCDIVSIFSKIYIYMKRRLAYMLIWGRPIYRIIRRIYVTLQNLNTFWRWYFVFQNWEYRL